jgi:AraC-like DNA-binding protein
MPANSSFDLIDVLKHLTAMFEPIATPQGVRLYFKSRQKQLRIDQSVDLVITALTDLLFKLIRYTGENNEISLSIEKKKDKDGSSVRILIMNTGTNLSRVTELNGHSKFIVQEVTSKDGGTSFEIGFPIDDRVPDRDVSAFEEVAPMPAFYAEVRKRVMLHFSKAEQLVAALAHSNPKEAAFLKKVNALIVENIGNPQMDANYISRALHMSRTQLFRRLKPIIRQSPGNYIKALKLQKAKELFQTTDLRINEVAFKTGFESPSHFTKAFVRHFGVKPSLFRRSKMQQMSK